MRDSRGRRRRGAIHTTGAWSSPAYNTAHWVEWWRVPTTRRSFCRHGYRALALGYFGLPSLPDYITRTPLEYFERTLAWARRNLEPANGFIAFCGASRGAEVGLLLGATFPEMINAVIGYAPSVFTNGALSAGRPGEDRHTPCWTYRGQDLPVLCGDRGPAVLDGERIGNL
jgi:hypothetical protein